MAIQSAVACSEATDDGLLVSWQLMERILVWVVSSSLAVEDGFLYIMDKSFDFSVGQMWWGLFLFPSCVVNAALLYSGQSSAPGFHYIWLCLPSPHCIQWLLFNRQSGNVSLHCVQISRQLEPKTAILL